MAGKRALSPEQESDVVRRYSTGESALAISRTLPVNVQTIHNTLRRLDVPKRAELTKRKLSDQQKALVIETCLGGTSVDATAKLIGTSPKTVFRILKAANIRLPTGRPRK